MKKQVTIVMMAVTAVLFGGCEIPGVYRENVGLIHGYYVRNSSDAPLFMQHGDEDHFLFPGDWDYWRVDTTLWRDTALLVFGTDDTVRHYVDRAEKTFTPSTHNTLDLKSFAIVDTVEFQEALSPDYIVNGREVRHVFLITDSDRQ